MIAFRKVATVLKYESYGSDGSLTFSDILAVCSTKKKAISLMCEILENVEDKLDEAYTPYTENCDLDKGVAKIEYGDNCSYRYYCVDYIVDELEQFL